MSDSKNILLFGMFLRNILTMKTIISTLVSFLLLQVSFAQTNVSGGIFSNTTWTLANSPYLVTNNIVVFPGVTLTIEPGVEVRIKENGLSGTQYYIEARGTINMVGQPGAKITFRADSATNTIGTWVGIVVKNSQGGAVNYNYVNMSNAIKCFEYDAGIPGLIQLNESDFRYNSYAIVVGTEFIAENCSFYGNENAVYGWSIFTFNNCIFDSNLVALSLYVSRIDIDNCSFTNNFTGLTLNSSALNGILVKNTIFNNNAVAFDNANSGTIDSCTFTNNIEAIKNTNYLEVKNSGFSNNGTALQIGFGTTVRDCEIEQNNIGIALQALSFGQPSPVVENNRICYNQAYNIDNRTDLNLFIPTNCFCSTDSSEVEDKIFDGYDDIAKGLISYAIFDTNCITVLNLVQKIGMPTSIVESENSAVTKVFPNPFIDNLIIKNLNSYSSYEILSLQGQLIQNGTIIEGENSIDVSKITTGTYSLGLHNADRKSEFIRVFHN